MSTDYKKAVMVVTNGKEVTLTGGVGLYLITEFM